MRQVKHVIPISTLALAAWLGPAPRGSDVRADERPTTSSAVQVPVQGGEGVEPVPGAPSPVAPSLEIRPVPATIGTLPAAPRASASKSSVAVRALSMKDGEATLERAGVHETVRPGSRLGSDTVRSVSPGRLVLDRPAAGRKPAALVIVTFGEGGRAEEQVFWMADPTTRAEVKRP